MSKPSNPGLLEPEPLLRKLILLTVFKEAYLFAANLYGFLFHPYKTSKKILADRSQLGIFISVAFSLILGGLISILLFYLIFLK